MAPPLWEVRQVEGKGRGVFATKHIKPGTVIMLDKPVLTIHYPTTVADVIQSFHRLDKEDQDRLLQLSEGPRPDGSQLMRIFHNNSFGNLDGESASLLLDASLVNHSCVPNATMSIDNMNPDMPSARELTARKSIAAGEEIYICYTPWYEGMPARNRAIPTLIRYGFVCSCPSCASPAPELQLSDARRLILGALTRALEGQKPDDLKWMDDSHEPFPESYPGPDWASFSYLQAAGLLLEQIEAMDDIIVLQSIELLMEWLEQAVHKMDQVRPRGRIDSMLAHTKLDDAKWKFHVIVGTSFIGRWVSVYGSRENMPFAILTGGKNGPTRIEQLSQAECKEIMRARGKGWS